MCVCVCERERERERERELDKIELESKNITSTVRQIFVNKNIKNKNISMTAKIDKN